MKNKSTTTLGLITFVILCGVVAIGIISVTLLIR